MTQQAIVTVNIGCKCGDTDMHDSQCAAFQQETEMLLAETVGKVSFTVDGQSKWQGESERGISFSVIDPALIGPDESKFGNPLQVLRIGLGNLAAWYGQEAIALVVGTSELVSPDKRYGHVSTSEQLFSDLDIRASEYHGKPVQRDGQWRDARLTANERSELTNKVTKLDCSLSANCHHGK